MFAPEGLRLNRRGNYIMTPEQTFARNKHLYEEYMKGGVTYAALGRKWNLSGTRVAQIVKGRARKLKAREGCWCPELSDRSSRVLKNAGFESKAEVREKVTYESLLRMPNMGRKGAREIMDWLETAREIVDWLETPDSDGEMS